MTKQFCDGCGKEFAHNHEIELEVVVRNRSSFSSSSSEGTKTIWCKSCSLMVEKVLEPRRR